MPKKQSKLQSQSRNGRIAASHGGASKFDNAGGSDEDFPNEDLSVASNTSTGSFPKDEITASNDNGAIVVSQDVIFEDKLKEAIDQTSQKSATTRVNGLEALCKGLIKKYIPEFVEDRKVTLSDIVERSIKKGMSSEVTSACNLASLLCTQLEDPDCIQDIYRDLKSPMMVALLDDAAPTAKRSSVAYALGTICFLVDDEGELEPVMTALEKVFLRNKTGPQISSLNADISALITAAVSSWSLLLTERPYAFAHNYLRDHLDVFEELLESPDVELRIAAGEALIILFENASEYDREDAFTVIEPIVPKLEELAKDSHKYRSKKDRKEQKSNFRDWIKTIEDGESFEEKFTINNREALWVKSWSEKKRYDSFCKVLGSGMNLHLSENLTLREIFGLGDPLPILAEVGTRPSKQNRINENNRTSKIRCQLRAKNRDKRLAHV